MTNQIALALGILLLIGIAIVAFLYGAGPFIFLGKQLLEFINWIAFWR